VRTDAHELEDALWKRVLGGDGEALGLVFDLHHQRVYRHARWILDNTHDAEDAAAGAFLELWRRRREVRQIDGSVLPWLLATTTNVCRNARRSQRRYRSLLVSLPRAETTTSAEEAAIDQAGVLEGIDPALTVRLRDLPTKTLGLFVLTAVEGHSVKEAAQAMGMSEGAAKTRLSRARSTLRIASASRHHAHQAEGSAP